MRRLLRWLWGMPPTPTPRLCDLCERDHHIHDVNSGECIDRTCECWVGI